jgi:hypothetical protein
VVVRVLRHIGASGGGGGGQPGQVFGQFLSESFLSGAHLILNSTSATNMASVMVGAGGGVFGAVLANRAVVNMT